MAEQQNRWGRVGDGGVVEVRLGDEWISVGAYPDGSADEALALFTRKFDDLEAQVALAEQRLKADSPAKDIARSVTKLAKELDTPVGVGDYQALRQRVDAISASLDELVAKQDEQREKALAEAVSTREALVTQMEALAAQDPGSIRWKQTTAEMTAIFERWKEHQSQSPRLPKQTADELWKRFRAARNSLDKARRIHFQERDKITKEVKATKRSLIERAEALAPKGAEGITTYRALLEEWKKAPRAGRALEDQLWARFKAAGDALYQAKAQQVEAEDEANKDNGEAKRQLITEFSDILSLSDHREALERLRLFHDRFRQIGPAPRALVKQLDQDIKKFDQHVKKLEAEHWEKTNPEKEARSQSFLEQIDSQISALELEKAQAEKDGDTARVHALTEELETKITWKRVLTDA